MPAPTAGIDDKTGNCEALWWPGQSRCGSGGGSGGRLSASRFTYFRSSKSGRPIAASNPRGPHKRPIRIQLFCSCPLELATTPVKRAHRTGMAKRISSSSALIDKQKISYLNSHAELAAADLVAPDGPASGAAGAGLLIAAALGAPRRCAGADRQPPPIWPPTADPCSLRPPAAPGRSGGAMQIAGARCGVAGVP